MPPRSKRAESAPATTTTAPESAPAGDKLPRQRKRPAKATATASAARAGAEVVELPAVPEPEKPAPKPIGYAYGVGSRVWVDIAYLDPDGPPEIQHVGSVVERRPNEAGTAAEYRLSGLPDVWVPGFRLRSV